jgi:hypothetical protein
METQTTPAKTIVAIVAGKFTGMLANFQVAAFGSLRKVGFSKEVAHKIASDYSSDLGNAMRSNDEFAAKVGKAKKDGDSVIKLSGKGSTLMTNAMGAIRVAQVIESLDKEGLLCSAKLQPGDFAENIGDYIADCEQWATEQTWAK